MNLNDMKPGERASVRELRNMGNMRRRLLDIGLIENTEIQCLGRSPGGDPTAFLIRGAVIAIRSEDCADIIVNTEDCAGRLAAQQEGGLVWA